MEGGGTNIIVCPWGQNTLATPLLPVGHVIVSRRGFSFFFFFLQDPAPKSTQSTIRTSKFHLKPRLPSPLASPQISMKLNYKSFIFCYFHKRSVEKGLCKPSPLMKVFWDKMSFTLPFRKMPSSPV